MTCNTCNQPIKSDEPSDEACCGTVDTRRVFHQNPANCVAATEAATARKCYYTAWAVEQAGENFVAAAIRRAYPKVFAKEEGR